jgi:chromosome condensin MukBEF MukE localization factor
MGYDNTLQGVMPQNISNSDLKRNFADLHDALRSGRHIQSSDGMWFEILRKKENFESLKVFYEEIYLVNLREDAKGYFYIDFFEGSKGKLSDTYSHNVIKKLDGWQHLVGVMLLKMFYEKWYDNDKIITWGDIYLEIIDKEYYAQYQRILFGKNRARAENLDENEIDFASNKFFRAITDFSKLGWVKVLVNKNEKENWEFRLNVSIHRFAELHQRDLDDIDTLTENVINKINTGKL